MSVESASKGPRSDHFKTVLMGVGQSPWTPNGTLDTTRSIITQFSVIGIYYFLQLETTVK